MNSMSQIGSDEETVARIREIVARHTLPPFVVGFDVQLGELEGEPAYWVVFKRVAVDVGEESSARERARQMNDLKWVILPDLLTTVRDRQPYFRSERAVAPG